MSIDEAQLSRYGEIVARLARPLADRAAVLWLLRLDASAFSALEKTCVSAMVADAEAAQVFARAFARAHAMLEAERSAEAQAPTVAAGGPPATRVEGHGGSSPEEAPTVALTEKARPQPSVELDEFTLASATNAITPKPRDGSDDG